MTTPWVAIPNQRCPNCGQIAELLTEALFAKENLDEQGRLMWATFMCPNKHGLVIPFKEAVSGSGTLTDD